MGSFVWDNEDVAVERAHNVVKDEDLKVFSGVPLNVVASQHVHKIVQVRPLMHFPWFLFTQISPPLLFTDALNLLCQVLGESLHLASKCLTQEA